MKKRSCEQQWCEPAVDCRAVMDFTATVPVPARVTRSLLSPALSSIASLVSLCRASSAGVPVLVAARLAQASVCTQCATTDHRPCQCHCAVSPRAAVCPQPQGQPSCSAAPRWHKKPKQARSVPCKGPCCSLLLLPTQGHQPGCPRSHNFIFSLRVLIRKCSLGRRESSFLCVTFSEAVKGTINLNFPRKHFVQSEHFFTLICHLCILFFLQNYWFSLPSGS